MRNRSLEKKNWKFSIIEIIVQNIMIVTTNIIKLVWIMIELSGGLAHQDTGKFPGGPESHGPIK